MMHFAIDALLDAIFKCNQKTLHYLVCVVYRLIIPGPSKFHELISLQHLKKNSYAWATLQDQIYISTVFLHNYAGMSCKDDLKRGNNTAVSASHKLRKAWPYSFRCCRDLWVTFPLHTNYVLLC